MEPSLERREEMKRELRKMIRAIHQQFAPLGYVLLTDFESHIAKKYIYLSKYGNDPNQIADIRIVVIYRRHIVLQDWICDIRLELHPDKTIDDFDVDWFAIYDLGVVIEDGLPMYSRN